VLRDGTGMLQCVVPKKIVRADDAVAWALRQLSGVVVDRAAPRRQLARVRCSRQHSLPAASMPPLGVGDRLP
jgi:hypothetical protein